MDEVFGMHKARPQPNHPDHEGAITTAQSTPRRRVSQGKVQLMPEKQYHGLQCTQAQDTKYWCH